MTYGPGKGWSSGKEFAERRACIQCGKAFYSPPVLRRRGGGKFCSNACKGKSMFKQIIVRSCKKCGESMSMPRDKVSRTCQKCTPVKAAKILTECAHCHKQTVGKLYCDISCYHAFRSAHLKPRMINPNATCKKCGASFYASPGHRAVGQGLYCSMACRPTPKHGRGNSGKREDLGIFVRSTWEANYARYLSWLHRSGQILCWEYEPITFEFKTIKKGVRFYTPDFRVTEITGDQIFHEVKGYMDDKSRIKLERMERFYPEHSVLLVGQERMKEIAKRFSAILPHWEPMRGM